MLGQVITVAIAGIVGYEALKFWKAKTQTFSMIQGHIYSVSLNYTSDPPQPVSTNQVQAQLDAIEQGGFSVTSAAMTPGPQSGIRQMALSVVRVGSSKDVPASTFTQGWPATFGTVTVNAATDMGGPQALAGATPSGAVGAVTAGTQAVASQINNILSQ